jgi:predicted 2-oxoglutarate/Fe(II)-dependent dioxygenase YbiX
MTSHVIGLGSGERAPDFVAPVIGGKETRFYSRAGGRPAVLFFAQTLNESDVATIRQVAQMASVHVIAPEKFTSPLPLPLQDVDHFLDDGAARGAFRLPADASAHAVLLDRNLRVLTTVALTDADVAQVIEQTLQQLPATAADTITAQAPVMFVPRVLEAGICAHLQQVWDRSHAETGVEQSVDTTRQEVIEAEAKRRADHVVEEADLMRNLTQSVGRRVIPEVRRIFGFNADRFEGFKISCYESSASGFFHAHRDNLSPATAHRRFAMTLNLNSEYEGGELRFPEFGDALYRPAAGEALIFACSMLHEVIPVTVGKRFTLLSFLFGAEARRHPGTSQPPTPSQSPTP